MTGQMDKCRDRQYEAKAVDGRPPNPPSPVCHLDPGHDGDHEGRTAAHQRLVTWPQTHLHHWVVPLPPSRGDNNRITVVCDNCGRHQEGYGTYVYAEQAVANFYAAHRNCAPDG